MRSLFFCILLFVSVPGWSQQDTIVVLKAVEQVRTALVAKDAEALQQLLHPALAFGHSSGWVQTKPEVFRDMRSGFLVYDKIESQSVEIKITGKYAIVKEKVAVQGSRDQKSFNLTLFVLQTWVKTRKGWKLLSRQSAKLG